MPHPHPYPLGVREPTGDQTLARFPRLYAAPAVDLDRESYVLPLPPKQDQGNAGSCVAQAMSAIAEAEVLRRDPAAGIALSRMDLYYGARKLRGWERQDGGSIPGDMGLWARNHGVVSEDLWPYDPARVTDTEPSDAVKQARPGHRLEFMSLNGLATVVGELEAGRCAAVAFPVYANFMRETAQDGWVRAPAGSIQGYHMLYVAGWDPAVTVPGFRPGAILMVNSWGNWGKPHPRLPRLDNCGWLPRQMAEDPAFALEWWGLLRGLNVEF